LLIFIYYPKLGNLLGQFKNEGADSYGNVIETNAFANSSIITSSN